MAFYINRRSGDGKYLETVDEFDKRKEAMENLREYRLMDDDGIHYLSTQCCKDWK